MSELKHKHKVEIKQLNHNKENWFEKIENARMRKMKLKQELEEKKRKEEKRNLIIVISILIFMIIAGIIISSLESKGIL